MIPGWLLVVAGGLGLVGAAMLGPGKLDQGASVGQTVAAHRGLVAAAVAVALGGAGWQLVDRAGAASRLASVATQALATAAMGQVGEAGGGLPPDLRAYQACVRAKASWLEQRMNSERLLQLAQELDTTSQRNQGRDNVDRPMESDLVADPSPTGEPVPAAEPDPAPEADTEESDSPAETDATAGPAPAEGASAPPASDPSEPNLTESAAAEPALPPAPPSATENR